MPPSPESRVPRIEPEKKGGPISFAAKRFLKNTPQLVNLRTIRFLTSVIRTVRKMATGHRIAPSPPDAESRLPEGAAPCQELQYSLDHLDAQQEIARRRELYLLLDSIIRKSGYEPVFPSLPDNVVPYAYPFYSSEDRIGAARQILTNINLECFSWPELPDAVKQNAPERYRSVWMVGFLW